jgi:hypothetical protein
MTVISHQDPTSEGIIVGIDGGIAYSRPIGCAAHRAQDARIGQMAISLQQSHSGVAVLVKKMIRIRHTAARDPPWKTSIRQLLPEKPLYPDLKSFKEEGVRLYIESAGIGRQPPGGITRGGPIDVVFRAGEKGTPVSRGLIMHGSTPPAAIAIVVPLRLLMGTDEERPNSFRLWHHKVVRTGNETVGGICAFNREDIISVGPLDIAWVNYSFMPCSATLSINIR